LNSDTRVLPGSVDDAVRFLDEHPAAGLVGVRLLNPDGTFQASYTPFPTLWLEFLTLAGLGKRFVRPRFPSYGPLVERGPCKVEGYMEGAYLMARRDAVAQVGSLDEQIFMYAEDVDWCYRFRRANWEVWYLAHIAIVHYGGQSTRQRSGPMEAELYRSRIYFFGKHYGPAAAWLLKAMIYTITPIKWVVHRGVRLVSGGKKGRNVVGWRQLYATLHRDS
jgi:N-acetylglucosaminyl-diphospho-decaprenol L-rhamnosyltransferase